MPQQFPLGRLVMTRGVAQTIALEDVLAALARHAQGDWGEVYAEDARANEYALKQGLRLFSVYRMTSGTTCWVITEADRSSTTVLLPDEY